MKSSMQHVRCFADLQGVIVDCSVFNEEERDYVFFLCGQWLGLYDASNWLTYRMISYDMSTYTTFGSGLENNPRGLLGGLLTGNMSSI